MSNIYLLEFRLDPNSPLTDEQKAIISSKNEIITAIEEHITNAKNNLQETQIPIAPVREFSSISRSMQSIEHERVSAAKNFITIKTLYKFLHATKKKDISRLSNEELNAHQELIETLEDKIKKSHSDLMVNFELIINEFTEMQIDFELMNSEANHEISAITKISNRMYKTFKLD